MPHSTMPASISGYHGYSNINKNNWPKNIPLDWSDEIEILEKVYNTDKNCEKS
jgi:hypothetical protein